MKRTITNAVPPRFPASPGGIRVLIFLAAIIMCQALSLEAMDKTIYGSDDRVDFYQVTDRVERRGMSSAVSLFKSAAALSNEGGYYRFAGDILGAESRRLCPGERFFDQRTGAFCSGTLIAPDLVLTAGHCMRTIPGDPDRCSQTKFVFGFSIAAEGASPESVPASGVYSCAAILLYAYGEGKDYAVVRLDRPAAGHKPAPLEFGPVNEGAGIFTVGGPYGVPLKVLGGGRVRRVDHANGIMITDLDSSGGNSGGGVFSSDTGRVVAVHKGSRDPDLANIPLPAGHGLPAWDRRVTEGECRTAVRYPDSGGDGKKAVLISAIPGLADLLGAQKAMDVDTGLRDFDFTPDNDKVLAIGALLR